MKCEICSQYVGLVVREMFQRNREVYVSHVLKELKERVGTSSTERPEELSKLISLGDEYCRKNPDIVKRQANDGSYAFMPRPGSRPKLFEDWSGCLHSSLSLRNEINQEFIRRGNI